MKRNKKEEELVYRGLRRDFSAYVRQSDLWFRNARSFKRTSELLLKQQKIDDEGFEQRREQLQKHVEAGGHVNAPFGIHPPFLLGTIAFTMAMSIELQLKAILIAIRPMEFVTENHLNKSLTTHNIQQLIKLVKERMPNTIQARCKRKLIDKLSLIIIWGRYGFPKDTREFRKFVELEIGHENVGMVTLSKGEISSCRELYDDLNCVYRTIMDYPSDPKFDVTSDEL